ncbi:MAG: Gfo/Idh/MocA family oxidoreductase [Planctomycetota bacterium]
MRESSTPRWSAVVVGLGRAGRARVREIESSEQFRLTGVVSRRESSGLTFEAALADRTNDVILVCTENALHGEQVRRALNAGRQVAVEFPLCLDPGEAKLLFALADEKRQVLHVEHIELLTASHRALREQLRAIGELRGGELRFQGGADGWIADLARGGFPSFSGIARLHVLWDAFGPLSARSATLQNFDDGLRFEAELVTERGATITWSEERRAGLSRGKHFRFEGTDGVLTSDDLEAESHTGGPSLFALDLEIIAGRLEGQPEAPGERERILGALRVAADCQTLAGVPEE